MVKKNNIRVIATLPPTAQANLVFLQEQFGLSKTSLIVLALNNYAEALRKEKRH